MQIFSLIVLLSLSSFVLNNNEQTNDQVKNEVPNEPTSSHDSTSN